MKLINVLECHTENTPDAELKVNLDTRPGVFFRIISGSYRTPFFNTSSNNVPVIMTHGDNGRNNVTVSIKDSVLTLRQGYQQEKFFFLLTLANNDWTDTAELRKAYIDSIQIVGVRDGENRYYDVSASMTASGKVRIKTTRGGHNYIHDVVLSNGKQYAVTIEMIPYQGEGIVPEYWYSDLPYVLECYGKD